MPTAPRSNKKAEEIFRDIMGEPRNVSKKISINKKKNNPNNFGDLYGHSKATGTGQLGNNDET